MDQEHLSKESFGTAGGVRKLAERSSYTGFHNVCNVGGCLVPFYCNRLGCSSWVVVGLGG